MSYGLNSKLNRSTGEIAYGFAKYLRDALPNASFIGFTGTPVEKDDINTRSVFGDYIDVYDISRAVEDGATVPIYYENRVARIEIDEDEKPKIDAEVAEITEDEAQTEQERLKRKWASVEALVGADKRLAMIAEDLIRHFEARSAALDGKAMIVCMSRRICVALRRRLHAVDAEGRLHVGVDCAIAIWLRTPGDVWLGRVLSLPVLHQIARVGYNRFADLLYAWNRWQGHR